MTFKENSQKTIREIFGLGSAKGDVGIEIELEGQGPLGVPCKGWQVHQENSLRNVDGVGHGGCEYVTHGAIKLNDVIPAVEALNVVLAKEAVRVNPDAHRTSTHIHVNVQQMPMINVLGYITVFTAIEPLLLALCGEKRDGNAFCASSYETGDLPQFFHDVCKSFESQPYFEQNRGKYASLSTFRLHDLGTLECRCFPQSLDAQEINKWCQWLLNIRTMVSIEDDKSFRQIIKQGIHDPQTLRSRIFGFNDRVVSDNMAAELINFGSQEAYELTRLLKRYLAKPAKDKKTKRPEDQQILDDLDEGIGVRVGPVFQNVGLDAAGWRTFAPQAVATPNPTPTRAATRARFTP